jgi:transcriptional regulator with XRE-family HTH domain
MVGRRDGLRAARRAAGHTLESFAEAVDVHRSTAIRWEAGDSDPLPRQRPKLAAVLRLSLFQIDQMLTESSSDSVPPSAPIPTRPDDASSERIHAVLGNPRSVDLVTVAALRQNIQALDASYDVTPSALLLGQAGQWLGHIMNLKCYANGRVSSALCGAEAEAAILLGRLVWDASQRREHHAAIFYFDQARAAARQAHDPTAEGTALLRRSFVALYGHRDPASGLDFAAQAAKVGVATSSVIAGLGLLHTAEAQAMFGCRRECEAALAEAAGFLNAVDPVDPAVDLYSSTQPTRLAGSCYLFLGDQIKAERILESTTHGFNGLSKSQAIVWGNLGLACIRQAKLDQATDALHHAIDVIEHTRGGGGLNIVFDAGRELRPWRNLTAVRDIQDRLLTLMTTAAGGPP